MNRTKNKLPRVGGKITSHLNAFYVLWARNYMNKDSVLYETWEHVRRIIFILYCLEFILLG